MTNVFDGSHPERLDGRGRRVNLTAPEREALQRRQLIERAVSLFLDIAEHRSTAQIAEALGLTIRQLKLLTQDPEFIDLYSEYYLEVGHDPRLIAVRAAISDLLPEAFNQLSELLSGANTNATTRMRAIEKIFQLGGVRPVDPKSSDKKDVAEFLTEAGVETPETQAPAVPVPAEFLRAFDEVLAGNFTDDRELDDHTEAPPTVQVPPEVSDTGNAGTFLDAINPTTR